MCVVELWMFYNRINGCLIGIVSTQKTVRLNPAMNGKRIHKKWIIFHTVEQETIMGVQSSSSKFKRNYFVYNDGGGSSIVVQLPFA